MNKLWQNRLDGLRSTITNVSALSDGAARIRQGLAADGRSGMPASPEAGDKQQFLRLPVESAKKLRWYDRADLSTLVMQNLKDKQELQAVNEALHQVLVNQGLAPEAVDEEVQAMLAGAEKMRFYDDSVNAVLVASATAEISSLREQLAAQAAQMAELGAQLRDMQQRLPSGGSTPAVPPLAPASLPADAASERPAEHVSLRLTVAPEGHVQSSLVCEPASTGQLDFQGYSSTHHSRAASMASHDWASGLDAGPADAPAELAGERDQQHLGSAAEAQAQVQHLQQELAQAKRQLHESQELAEGQLQARKCSAHLSTDGSSMDPRQGISALLQELRGKLTANGAQHVETLQRVQGICMEAERRAEAADRRCARLEGELKDSRADIRRVANTLRGLEQERDKAQGRAQAAEAALAEAVSKGQVHADKGAAATGALATARKQAEEREAELRRAMRDGEARLRERLGQLEADNVSLRRSVASGASETQEVLARLAAAEEAEAQAFRELRDAEAALVDREELTARLAVLEERLAESRAEQGQLQTYKQLARELEAAKARVEEEVLATVHIATGLETRLRAAKGEAEAAQEAAVLAQQRAQQAEREVTAEVQRRLEAMGDDRTQWPAAARDECIRMERKQQGLRGMLAALQQDLDTEVALRDSDAATKTALQQRAAAAEERADRAERERSQSTSSLQSLVAELQEQLEQLRRDAAAAEEERDKLLVLSQRSPFSHAKPGLETPTMRSGGSMHSARLGRAGSTQSDASLPREHVAGVDVMYLKNVLLKFIDAHAHGQTQQCEVLLPAVATLLNASPAEFRTLKTTIQTSDRTGTWLARML